MSDDPRDYFAVEARELLEGLTQGALHASRERTLGETQRRHLLRLAHTLKGAARIVRERALADGAHALEDLIASAPESLAADFGPQLLSRIDALQRLLPAPAPAAAAAADAPEQGLRNIALDASDLDAILARMVDMNARCAAIRQDLARADGAAAAANGLHALAGELAEARDDLRRLRMTPASAVFVPLERAVHDAAAAAAVRARFTGSGGEHRLDAAALATVRDALVQLVRNAVAHGIEPPGVRLAAGKPAEGIVALRVERRGAEVAFVVKDDGRGIDFEALRHASPAAATLSDDQLIERLLAGGLTSRGTASQLAGRGVGLDVVRSTVARLNGRLTLQHQPQAGTAVEIVVPAAIRSLTTLLVEAGGRTALLPLDSVSRVVSLRDATFLRNGGARELVMDDRAVPVVPLRHVLGGAADGPRHGDDQIAVLVQAANRTVALLSARVRESATVIVESPPPLSGASAAVRGLAVNDRGTAVPVLEPDELMAFAGAADAPDPPPRRAPHILVVDDSITTRMLEQSILETAGYRVDTAVSGEDALDRAARTSYDLLIVDVEMPGMSGFELLDHLREDSRLAAIPSMLVSSRASEEDRRRGRAAGARAYIVKGEFDQDVFLRTVESFVA